MPSLSLSITSSITGKGTKKPFAGNSWATKAILDLYFQSGGIEHAMKEVFEFRPIDVEQLVFFYDFNISHEKSWLEARARDTLLYCV